jgi:putative tryptophan/tyrosine transport system substrate-binding protein
LSSSNREDQCMMDRRQLLLFGMSAGLTRGEALAQQGRVPLIGVLWHAATPEDEAIYLEPLKSGLADVGYVEGKDYKLVETYAAEKYERFNANAALLVEKKVDVIVAVTGPATAAAQRATTTLPIVFVVVPDPVGRKFAQSLSRPGAISQGSQRLQSTSAPNALNCFRRPCPTWRESVCS